ncbi:MAG: hypothetical protein U0703_05615 [Anaerolineae bacterium]
MAPDDVAQQVRAHYLDAIHWLNDSMLMSWAQQWAGAPKHLNGSYLKRYRNLLLTQRESAPLTGVLRADHSIEVREFSETGGFCLVIDQQTGRRMATYNRRSHARLHTRFGRRRGRPRHALRRRRRALEDRRIFAGTPARLAHPRDSTPSPNCPAQSGATIK